MGWLKKKIKQVGKGIKKIGKGIGKAFKKVFKGIGKFVGKLGPIGMLGMMLIMPQLGAWWGQFTTWTQGLTGPLSSVMKGLQWAGSKVGTAMTTVTEGIQKTLNVVTGGTFSTAGAAGYEAGLSDNFANWMSGQLDKGREFLGLETATPIGTPDIDVTDVVPDTTTSRYDEKGFLKDPDSYKSPSDFAAEDALSDDFGTLGEGERIVKAGDKLGERIQSAITGKDDISTWDKIVDKGKRGYTVFKTGQEVAQTFADDPYDIETGWNNYVADNMVGYYDSAIEDYNSLGYVGQSSYGMGNDNFFASTYNLGQTDPWLWQQYMKAT